MWQLLLLAAVSGLAQAEYRSYEGYQVYKTQELSQVQLNAIHKLPMIEFLKDPAVGRVSNIMVAPEHQSAFKKLLEHNHIDYIVANENVEEVAEADRQRRANLKDNPRSTRQADSLISFDRYYRYDDIVQYMFNVSQLQDWVNVVEIGTTYEGRTMYALEITKAGDGAVANIYSQAGIHAREWIAPAVAMYTIYELVENYDENTEYTDNFNFYLVPSANPDGYEYTWDVDRFWRKTRSDQTDSVCPSQVCRPQDCMGVDPNRNWDFQWAVSGSSPFACSDIFQGPFAFSEVELRNLDEYFRGVSPQPALAVCFHSAAEKWLYPYGYDDDAVPPNVDEMIDMADAAVDALNALNGENFEVIQAGVFGEASGASDDYFTSLGTRFVYTPELREGPGLGVNVFVLPEDEIEPSGAEVWEAWKAMLDILANE